MERRALIAFVVSLVILLGYQEILKFYYPVPQQRTEAPLEPTVPAQIPPQAGAPVAEEPSKAPATAPEGHDVIVETDLFRAVFTTAGARLKHFALNRYRSTVDRESPPLDLLVNTVPGDLPLGLELRGNNKRITDAQASYRVDRDKLLLSGGARDSITFTTEVDGMTIVKRIDVQGNRYLAGVELQVEGAGSAYSEMGLSWNAMMPRIHVPGSEVLFDSVVNIRNDKFEHRLWTSVDATHEVYDKNVQWLGQSGRYFLAVMVPPSDAVGATRMWLKRHDDLIETQLLLPAGTLRSRIDLYVGPKEIHVLEDEDHSLRRAVDLGMFTFIALPLLQALKLSHRVTGNYGIDIILLTVFIKVLFIPLTRSSLRSMREMQKLQPQMTKIREKLKDKPDEMNKEIMELYRSRKVNPLGGCLPMILQMPVFLGLYNALLNAVELRHAPFAGWIRDLSAPDRLGSMHLPFVEQPGIPILTLLMGVSMFIQQWKTPATTADPAQQRVMMIMPLMFTFMFINFPAGLTLYWLVNNILTIAQQYGISRPER